MGAQTLAGFPKLAETMIRHISDLTHMQYEGVENDREAKNAAFLRGFDLTTPVAEASLGGINKILLADSGTVSVTRPASDGKGGLFGVWSISWPMLENTLDRFTNKPMPPIRIAAAFSVGLFHPHLALMRVSEYEADQDPDNWGAGPNIICTWPFQVTSDEDASNLEPLFWSLALGELHERTVHAEGGWRRILPEYDEPTSWGHAVSS